MVKKIRPVVGAFLVGALSVGSALAGVVLSPSIPHPPPEALDVGAVGPAQTSAQVRNPDDIEVTPEEVAGILSAGGQFTPGPRLHTANFLVGASRGSLYPAPEHFGGTAGQWQTAGCTEIDEAHLDQDHAVASMQDIRGWPTASPDCIYLGGFGIGPARAAHGVGFGGVWVRSIAISNGEKVFVYQITDTVGWFARYDASICSDCGILDVRNRISSETGVPVGDLIIGSTHSHASADTYGGWGGIPRWYRNQLRDTTIASAVQAVANLQPATIEIGEAQLRKRNGERRDTYFSNADTEATWLQARGIARVNGVRPVIATLSTFAAHPTIVSDPILHADWPGAAAREFERAYAGVGLMFEGGLGNISVSGVGGATKVENAENTGKAIANDISAAIAKDPMALSDNDMRSSTKPFGHPVLTNPGLTTLASAGFFDREFMPFSPGADGPGVYHWSKPWAASAGEQRGNPAKGENLRSCDTAGPVQINTVAGAHRIGGLLIAFAPGEIFSNIAEVAKENANGASLAMVFGQTNDALGYIIQSFEYDKLGNAATEYGTMTGEYEEVFAVDHCFGDHVLDVILQSTKDVGLG